MRIRRASATAALLVLLAACSSSPPPAPQGGSPEPTGGSVLEEARPAANDAGERQVVIDEQMRDPFSPPSASN